MWALVAFWFICVMLADDRVATRDNYWTDIVGLARQRIIRRICVRPAHESGRVMPFF